MFNGNATDIRVELYDQRDPKRNHIAWFDGAFSKAASYAQNSVINGTWTKAHLIVARWTKETDEFTDAESFVYRKDGTTCFGSLSPS